MSTTYFTKQPEPCLSIPATFDAKAVRLTLEELTSWSGQWPSVADEASLQIALAHVKSPAEAERLYKFTEKPPQMHAAFLRLLPAKYFTAKVVNEYDSLTVLFARLRKLKLKQPPGCDTISITDQAQWLTDDEIDRAIEALVAEKAHENRFESEQVARRMFGRTSEEQLVALWQKVGVVPWVAVRALTDAQLLRLLARALDNDLSGSQGALWFDAIRRGLMTEQLLAARLASLEASEHTFAIDNWLSAPEGWADQAAEAAAMRELHTQVQPFVGMLRAWLVKIAPGHVRSDLFTERSLWLLAVIAWSDEVAALVLPQVEAGADKLKESYQQTRATATIADMVTGAPHADAIMAALGEVARSKRVKDVLEQARARLANRRALLGATEAIEWGRTDTTDAFAMVQAFRAPLVAIARGLESDDPVAILNAWTVAARLYWDQKNVRKVEVTPLSPDEHIAALRRLERLYTPDAPDKAALEKLIGLQGHAAKMFDTAFDAASESDPSGRVWQEAGELYRNTSNRRFKEWIEPYLPRMDESLIEDVPTKLARLLAECAQDASLADTVERCVIVRTKTPAAKTTTNRLFGPPIGVDAKTWPTHGRKKMAHLMTLELSALCEDARASFANAEAIAVFVDSLDKGVQAAEVVSLTKAQLAKGTAPASRGHEAGYALDVLRVRVPARVFQGGKKTGPLFELRKLFDRTDVVIPGSGPHWIQEPEVAGTFLFELHPSFASELNLGDAGRLYVFDSTAVMQSH